MVGERHRPIIVGLDIIRFAAAAMVMCFHFCTSWANKDAIGNQIVGGRAAFPELFGGTWFGWLGVEIFFVISGLVIAYSAEGATAPAFFRSRVLRLYPAAWVCATITAITAVALGLATHRHVLREWAASIMLFPFPPWIDPVYWTLGVEISFYALVFLLLAVRRFHYLERVVLVLGYVSSAYWILGTAFAPDFLQQHLWNRKLELSLVSYGCFFGVGALTYVISREGLSLIRILAMTLFVAAGLIEVSYKTVHSDIFNSNQSALLPQLLYVLAVVCIFVSIRTTASRANRAARLIRMLGLATYPLYLFHQIVGAALMKAVLTQGGSKYLALGSAILLCVAGSVLIANLIEPPIRALLRRLLFWMGGLPVWNWMALRVAGIAQTRLRG
jgi:peptidoglycan/LPS O-acetylase OafA/YrhL